MCVYKRIKQVSVLKGVKLTVNCLDRYELYRLSLELDGKKRNFMDRFFCFLLRTKSVLRLKNRSRTGKTDDFSSPAPEYLHNWGHKYLGPSYNTDIDMDDCFRRTETDLLFGVIPDPLGKLCFFSIVKQEFQSGTAVLLDESKGKGKIVE